MNAVYFLAAWFVVATVMGLVLKRAAEAPYDEDE